MQNNDKNVLEEKAKKAGEILVYNISIHAYEILNKSLTNIGSYTLQKPSRQNYITAYEISYKRER